MAETHMITSESVSNVKIKFVQIFTMIYIKNETSKLTEGFKSPINRTLNGLISWEC